MLLQSSRQHIIKELTENSANTGNYNRNPIILDRTYGKVKSKHLINGVP